MMTVTRTDIAEKAAGRLAEVGAPPAQEELEELPSLFATALSDDVEAALDAVGQLGYHLLASDTVDPLSGPLLEPLCAAAGEAHPVVQSEIWQLLAYVAGRMGDPASRDAHEVFRPYATGRIAEQVLRERLDAHAVCSLAALAVSYPDWGRLGTLKLAKAFEAAQPLTVVRSVTALSLLGLGVVRDDIVAELQRVQEQAVSDGEVSLALKDVLVPEPLGSLNYIAPDYDIHHAMTVCVPGNRWGNITVDTLVPLDY